MASLLPSTATPTALQQNIKPFCNKPTSHTHLFSLTCFPNRHSLRCSAFQIGDLLHSTNLDGSLSELPVFQSGMSLVNTVTGQLPEQEKWGVFIFAGVAWIYLTARPGVLIGAIDAYLLAPLQLTLASLTGRRGFTTRDFVVGARLGEGSFGVVYSGAMVPKNMSEEEKLRKIGKGKGLMLDKNFKDRVILKMVKIGVKGAEECGDYEEWFNYRLSRAAPETCAEFLGSFIADKTNSQFTKGGKWLVWKFEGDLDLADYMRDRSFPSNRKEFCTGPWFA